jgi:2-C-methyl-D-erythritol 4-phosphate cytidylyltransferase
MSMNSISVIITAGGIGKRMGGTVPKQFLVIGSKPILIHTLETIHNYLPHAEILLTLPLEWEDYWKGLLNENNCRVEHRIINGGEERYHSVRNAVRESLGDYIFIHDGVRPFVSVDTIQRCLLGVIRLKAVIPVVPIKESLRKISDDSSAAVDRSSYRLVQTPQCFSRDIITKAYELPYHLGITDDASLVEETGCEVHLVDGNEENIKITSPTDLLMAEVLMNKK